MQHSDDYEPTEAEEWAAGYEHLDKVYAEEQAVLLSSLAINHNLKEKGLMQVINTVIDNSQSAEFAAISANQMLATNEAPAPDDDGGVWFEGADMEAILSQPTQELQSAKVHEILSSGAVHTPKDPSYNTEGPFTPPAEVIGMSDEKQFSGTDLAAAFLEAKEKLGGDAVVMDSLEDVVAATATNSTIKPPTKKQLKAQKHLQKNMQSYMKKAQKQAQTQHILNKLYTHSIRTPEQARQIHAAQLAKAEIIEKLGQRQADAFFAAKPETKCHDFFPKPTIEANPTLMTSVQGESRTLAQVYEYFIYKHFMLLTKKAETPFEGDLNTSVDWANAEVKPYVVYEEDAPVEEAQAETTESTYSEEDEKEAA
jgi:hypothetical protein